MSKWIFIYFCLFFFPSALVFAQCVDTTWSPDQSTQCANQSFIQVSNCGRQRSVGGTFFPRDFSPLVTAVCSGESYFSQNSCGHTRQFVGTRTPQDWSPAPTTVCSGDSFKQTNSCGHERTTTGTKSCCQVSSWSPGRSTVCQGQSFTQTSNCGTTRQSTGTKTSNNFTPNSNTVCQGQQFTQTNGCGETRSASGTLQVGQYFPLPNTICSGQTFTQSATCQQDRQAVGTKTDGDCCVDTEWFPDVDTSTVCTDLSVRQTSNCGRERIVGGTNPGGEFTPATNTQCEGVSFTQTNSCGNQRGAIGSNRFGIDCGVDLGDVDGLIGRLAKDSPIVSFTQPLGDGRYPGELFPVEIFGPGLENERAHPVFLRTAFEFEAFRQVMATNSYNNNPQPDDDITYCLRTDKAPTISAWTDTTARSGQCGTFSVEQTRTCSFNTKGEDQPLCDECEGVALSQIVDYTNSPSGGTWLPDPSTMCEGDTFEQTLTGGSCVDTRNNVGTHRPNDWIPAADTQCAGTPVPQTNSCGHNQTVPGTLAAGPWIPNSNTQCPGTPVVQGNSCGGDQTVDGTRTSGCGNNGNGNGNGSGSGSDENHWQVTDINTIANFEFTPSTFADLEGRSCFTWQFFPSNPLEDAKGRAVFLQSIGNPPGVIPPACFSPGATDVCFEWTLPIGCTGGGVGGLTCLPGLIGREGPRTSKTVTCQ